MDTLKTLLESGKLKTSYLEVQIIKRIGKDSFIVADGSKVAVFDTREMVGKENNLTVFNFTLFSLSSVSASLLLLAIS